MCLQLRSRSPPLSFALRKGGKRLGRDGGACASPSQSQTIASTAATPSGGAASGAVATPDGEAADAAASSTGEATSRAAATPSREAAGGAVARTIHERWETPNAQLSSRQVPDELFYTIGSSSGGALQKCRAMVKVADKYLRAVIDTGADCSLLARRVYEALKASLPPLLPVRKGTQLSSVTGARVRLEWMHHAEIQSKQP